MKQKSGVAMQGRDPNRAVSPSNLIQDLRYGIRVLRKYPIFSLMAVLTLALGIGANTAIFSVMNAVLLRYLPISDPQRVVYLRTTSLPHHVSQTGNTSRSFSGFTFEQLRDQASGALSELIAYVPLSNSGEVAVRHGQEPDTARLMMVSGNFFSGLGVQPARGRVFTLEEERSRSSVTVLSYSYWTRRFARNPSALGATLFIKGIPFTIIGVAAEGFEGVVQGARTDLWIPLQTRPELGPWGQSVEGAEFSYSSPQWWFLMLMGRLAPGISEERALAQLNPLFHNTAYPDRSPQENENPPEIYFTSARGLESVNDLAEHPLSLLMAMVVLVLVIACGNIVMLLVARNTARRREFGLRLALGAGRIHLFRQLLTESLLLVFAGGALGWIFASLATGPLAALSGVETSLDPDRSVLAFTFGVCLLAAVAFGLIPLRSALKVPATQALRATGSTSNQERGGFWSGRAVVALQMALCLALLVSAGLLVRTLSNLRNVDLGFEASNLLVFGLNPQRDSDAETVRFYQELLDELRVLPGVDSATLMGNRIGSGWSNNTSVSVDGAPATDSMGRSVLRWNIVGPDYFQTLGVPILNGRDLRDSDGPESPPVLVVNRTFVESYLPQGDPLGHLVQLGGADRASMIVGVAEDSKYTTVRETPRPMAYLPYTQIPGIKMLHAEVRSRRTPESLIPEVRALVRRLDPELPLMEPASQEAQFEQTYSESSLFARLALFFGLLATLLVALGLYGTLAYRVARRTTEIGVRMALGAKRRQVLWMMLRESLLVGLAGAALGLPLAYFGAGLLRSNLFGLEPDDPASFLAALVAVLLVTLGASLTPARRASSVDPIQAIRTE